MFPNDVEQNKASVKDRLSPLNTKCWIVLCWIDLSVFIYLQYLHILNFIT